VLAYPSRLNGPDEAMQKGRKALRARSYAQARGFLFDSVCPGCARTKVLGFDVGWCFLNFVFDSIPSPPPSSAVEPGDVGEDCLRPQAEFRSRPD
jgi:hypothetical protein